MEEQGDSGGSQDSSVVVDDAEPSTSKRKRSCSTNSRTRNNSTLPKTNELASSEWTEDEKMKLAIGLQRYGHKDPENLQKMVRTKSYDQIKAYTYWVIKKSRLWFCNDVAPGTKVPKKGGRTHSKAPIDQWLLAFEQAQSTNRDEFRECLAKAFLYISRYEPHPDPKDCDGVDYAAMYEFLYLALNGYPVKAVTPETAAALLNSLEGLSQALKNYGSERELEFLSKVKRIVYVENATKRHYGKKSKDIKPQGPIESLMDVKGFNPLNIPYELLKKRSDMPEKET